MSTTIPGVKASHAIITDICRANRTDAGAIDEAIHRLKEMAEQCLEGIPVGHGVQFHLVLTTQRPSSS